MTDDALLYELHVLRTRVAGITDTALASRDGLIICADTDVIRPENIAALAAAANGLARRIAAEVGIGTLRETMTRASAGCMVAYTVGSTALLIVIGDAGLDLARLFRESRLSIANLEELLERRSRPGPGSYVSSAG